MTQFEAIYDCETKTEIIRKYTEEQLTQAQLNKKLWEEEKAARLAKEIARQAVLERLGLTADEAKLLLS